MELLGVFLRGWFLKLILVIVIIFILLRAFEGFASFAAQLGAIQLATVAMIALTVFVAYKKRIWRLSNLVSDRNLRMRRHRLTKRDLTPKGIENGHVVFSAGRKGFRTLKFIEIGSELTQASGKRTAFELIHRETVKALPYIAAVAKKLRVEFSYELHWHDGTPRIIVTAVCEGRQYRRCRALIGEFARILTKDPRLKHNPPSSASQVDDNVKAEKILMSPLFSGLADLINIDSDDHNAILRSDGNPDRRTNVRIIQMLLTPRHHEDSEATLLDLLLRVTTPGNQARNLVCQFHVKPLPDSYLKRETKRLEEAYESAMARIVEEVNGRVRSDNRLLTRFLFGNDRNTTDAPSSAYEAKTRLMQLKEAEGSGILGVTMTVIGEPATVENTARQLKSEFSSFSTGRELRIQRLPPIAFQAAIGRISTTFSETLVARDLATFMTQSGLQHSARKGHFSVLNTMDF